MRDPAEGLSPQGTIVTGVDPAHVPAAFRPLLADAVAAFHTGLGPAADPSAELYLYGSVATGQARRGTSDVDLLLIGGSPDWAAEVADRLSARYRELCRGVEIGVGRPAEFVGDGDEAYGNRVFLRHYCTRLAGATRRQPVDPFPGDSRAARGFNGDIGRHLARWRAEESGVRRVGRKTLLAAAGLVSVRTSSWTTDRATAARAWAAFDPGRADEIDRLVGWSDAPADATDDALPAALAPGGIVATLVAEFAAEIGLWNRADP